MQTRATNLKELGAILRASFPAESEEKGLAFQPHKTDVIISPYTKSGTTWLQQIVHGLRTRGSMDFREISLVAPWIETAHDLGLDLEAKQVAEPRVYKSHSTYYDIPKGARYIVSFRHYKDVLISTFRFFDNFFIEKGRIGLEEFLRWRWPEERLDEVGYWYHLISWWEQRENEDVLLLCYEDMRHDLASTVERIAKFLNIELDEELMEIVMLQSSQNFMLDHKDQFNENVFLDHLIAKGILPPGGNAEKVTKGNSKEEKLSLSRALGNELDQYWIEHVGRRYGLNSYDMLCQELAHIN